MTSLQTPEASNLQNSNLAKSDNPAQRAPGQVDSAIGGIVQDFNGED